jgi:hypothetical protein
MVVKIKVLVACEMSQAVTKAFRGRGHEAYSCDILDTLGNPDWHIKGNVLEVLDQGWDLMIAHPPCTYLTSTGARWLYDPRFPDRFKQRDEAVEFALKLYNAPIEKIAIENPQGMLSSLWRPPDQYIQPYEFGHTTSKKTGLWLKNLPKLKPTKIVEVEYMTTSTGKRFSKWYWDTSKLKGEARQIERSKTFEGIALAMADQWT